MNPEKISFVGDLKNFPLRYLFFSLHAQRETGALLVRRDKVFRKVFFQNGQPVFVQSNKASESTVRRCYEKNIIGLSQLATLDEQTKQNGKKRAELIVENGWIDGHDFNRLENERIHSILEDLARWQYGSYLYVFDQQPPVGIAQQSAYDIRQIVLTSLKIEHDSFQLRDEIRDRLDRIPVLRAKPAEIQNELGLNNQQMNLVRLVNGKHGLEKILLGCGLLTSSAYHLLILMETMGFVHYQNDTGSAKKDSKDDQATVELGIEGINMMRRLESQGKSLLEKPPFAMFGISRPFNEEELRKGYYTIAQNFHQKEYVDKLPEELRKLSYQIFEKASAAFEALVIWVKKSDAGEFRPFLDQDNRDFIEREFPSLQAEISFLRGKNFFEEYKLDEALDEFANARTLESNEVEYHAWHAYVSLLTTPLDRAAMIRNISSDLRKSIRDDPESFDAHLLCAKAFERVGNIEEANRCYKCALSLRPSDKEIKESVRLTRMTLTARELDTVLTKTVDDANAEKELQDLLHGMSRNNYFEILGLEQNAGQRDVRNAYFTLAKKYHPDNYKNTRIHALAEKIFVYINEAYAILSSPKKRRAYERSIRVVETQKSNRQMERKIAEDRLLQKAKALLSRNEWEKACEFFGELLADENQNNWLNKVYYAWAEFNRDFRKDPSVNARLESTFKAALEQDPTLAEVFVLWGKYYRRLDNNSKARAQFQRALELDPNNVEAMRELRLINQRMGVTQEIGPEKETQTSLENGKKGLIGSLFGRKKGK